MTDTRGISHVAKKLASKQQPNANQLIKQVGTVHSSQRAISQLNKTKEELNFTPWGPTPADQLGVAHSPLTGASASGYNQIKANQAYNVT